MKYLKPTQREKNRYLVFSLACGSKCARDEVVQAVWASVLRFLGEIAAGGMSMWVMDWSDEKQAGILKTNSKSIKNLRIALAMLSRIGGSQAAVSVLGVSGTLKNAREKYLNA